MTDIERMNKVYSARLKYGDNKPRKFIHELPLPKHDISVGRKTPKSEFLKGLGLNQTLSKDRSDYLVNEIMNYCADLAMIEADLEIMEMDDNSEMVACYTGSK
jgi:hypothetical protein